MFSIERASGSYCQVVISQASETLMVESKFFAERWPVNASSTVF